MSQSIRQIGRTGREVKSIGLGGMPMSIAGRPDENQSLQTIKAAIDSGVDFIDTADCYCLDDNDFGHNERLIAKALKEFGSSNVAVATKGGLTRPDGAWESHGTPDRLRSACDASLAALGVDSIFLYQLHAPTEDCPFEDSVGAMKELQDSGKVQHVGISNVSLEQLKIAQGICEIASVQNYCNALRPDHYCDGLVEHCQNTGVTFLPHSPVGGFGKHSELVSNPTLQKLSQKNNCSPYVLLLAWHLAKSPCVIAIPGASRPESIQDSATASELQLSQEDVNEIDNLNQQTSGGSV